MIMRFPSCQVLAIKFLADKRRMFISLSCGLIILVNTTDMTISKILFAHAFVIDKMKIILNGNKLIAGGID